MPAVGLHSVCSRSMPGSMRGLVRAARARQEGSLCTARRAASVCAAVGGEPESLVVSARAPPVGPLDRSLSGAPHGCPLFSCSSRSGASVASVAGELQSLAQLALSRGTSLCQLRASSSRNHSYSANSNHRGLIVGACYGVCDNTRIWYGRRHRQQIEKHDSGTMPPHCVVCRSMPPRKVSRRRWGYSCRHISCCSCLM